MTKRSRYNLTSAARKFWLSFLDLLEERTLLVFVLILLCIISSTAVVFSLVDSNNQHPIWRSVVYVMSGMDVDPPETPIGQFTAVVVLFSGIVFVSLLTGYIAAGFTNLLVSSRNIPPKPLKRIFENHIVLFGWGSKTRAVLRELNESYTYSRAIGHDIIVVSNDAFLTKGSENIYKHVWHVRGSQVDSSSMRAADISSHHGAGAKVAAILSDNTLSADEADRKSLLTVLAVEHSHPQIHSIAEVQLDSNERHFQNANTNEVVQPSQFTSLLLARTLEFPGIASYMDELLALALPEESSDTASRKAEPISLFVTTASELGITGQQIHHAVKTHYVDQSSIIVGVVDSQGLRFLPDIPADGPPLARDSQIAVIRRPESKSL